MAGRVWPQAAQMGEKGRKVSIADAMQPSCLHRFCFVHFIDPDPQHLLLTLKNNSLINLIAAERAVDTLAWQLLASVAVPGFTIHNVVAAATWLLGLLEDTEPARRLVEAAANATTIPAETLLTTINKALPTAIGLAVIPLIVHPIDHGVHALLNATLRPALRKVICRSGGSAAGLPICRTGDGSCTEDDIKHE